MRRAVKTVEVITTYAMYAVSVANEQINTNSASLLQHGAGNLKSKRWQGYAF